MELVFLGTGAGVPSKSRNVSSIALKLLDELNEIWLFDCGEATQHQILHTSIRPRKIKRIFISHMHGDHIYGLPGLLVSRQNQGGQDPMTIYGPKGIKEFVLTNLRLSHSRLSYAIKFVELEDDQTIIDDATFKVSAYTLEHGVKSFGYRVEEKDSIGHLQADRLIADGLPAGPLFGQLKQKGEVEHNGKLYKRDDYLSAPVKGRIVGIILDTRRTAKREKIAKNCDALIHEATFKSADKDLAYNYYHSTINDAAELAKSCQVKQLYLTHISSRYLGEELKQFIQEAKHAFAETIVARDLDHFEVMIKDD
ncbi:ribonuclease Z [Atopobacter phocae]|uniref:ribonuclease Z n=1 Tax=Atopobacter phocae TaxID=136492 RepID=UPI0004712005|nr:ribonuclease Z [Atopobacter phocae]